MALASEVEGAIVCEPVYAELMASARGLEGVKHKILNFLDALDVTLLSSREDSLAVAGDAYFKYITARAGAIHVECSSCGEKMVIRCSSCRQVVKWRQHIASDFIIGGHAQTVCGRIITRDKGFYDKHFPKLKVYTPSSTSKSSTRSRSVFSEPRRRPFNNEHGDRIRIRKARSSWGLRWPSFYDLR